MGSTRQLTKGELTMYDPHAPRKQTPKARKVARWLDENLQPGEAVAVRDLADVLATKYGKSARSWYVLVAQLWNGGVPARKYLSGYEKVWTHTGHVAIAKLDERRGWSPIELDKE